MKSIIKYEEEIIKKEMKALPASARRGEQASFLYSLLSSKKVFSSNANIREDGKKKGIMWEYAFLYDYFRIMECNLNDLFNKKDKHDKVKGWVKSYNNVKDKEKTK